jgi:ribosomal protein S18 acetylase RimI-like enzyme
MTRVADLIETSFTGDLDQAALVMMREMRLFGSAGWIGYVLGRFFLPPAAYPDGFVWEQAGDIIGNASLMPAGERAVRWVLANVAVHPDHRRQGIGRRLVVACLEWARARGARELVLQVNHRNDPAIQLYRKLDFEELTTRTEWVRKTARIEGTDHRGGIRDRNRSEWTTQWHWAQQLFPEGIQWPYALSRDWFRPRTRLRVFSAISARHWVLVDETGQVQGSLTARYSRDHLGWQLALLVPPSSPESVEAHSWMGRSLA